MVRAHSERSVDALVSDFILEQSLENIELIHEQLRGAYDGESREEGEGQLNTREERNELQQTPLLASSASPSLRALASVDASTDALRIFIKRLCDENREHSEYEDAMLLDIIGVFASASCSPRTLRFWFETIAKNRKRKKEGVEALLRSVRNANGRSATSSFSPKCCFHLDGENAGILGNAEAKWPFAKDGFSVVTYVYVNSFENSETNQINAEALAQAAQISTPNMKISPTAAQVLASAAAGSKVEYMPRLFSLLSSEGSSGYESYFHKNYLIFEAQGEKGERITLPFSHQFQLKTWLCVGVEYSVKREMASLYINGKLVETHSMKLPKVTKPLGFCCLGTNPPAAMAGMQDKRRQCALYAELGPVYIFRDGLGTQAFKKLYERGGDYVPCYVGQYRDSLLTTALSQSIIGGHSSGGGENNSTHHHHESSTDPFARTASGNVATSTAPTTTEGEEDEAEIFDKSLSPKLLQLFHPSVSKLNIKSVTNLAPSGSSNAGRKGILIGNTKVFKRDLIRDSMWENFQPGPCEMLRLLLDEEGKEDNRIVDKSNACLILQVMVELARSHSQSVQAMASMNLGRLLSQILPRLFQETPNEDSLHVEICKLLGKLLVISREHDGLYDEMLASLYLTLKPYAQTGCSSNGIVEVLRSLNAEAHANASALVKLNGLQMLLDTGWDNIEMLRSNEDIAEELTLSLFVIVSAGDAIEASKILLEFISAFDGTQGYSLIISKGLKALNRAVHALNHSFRSAFTENFIGQGGIEILMRLLRKVAMKNEEDGTSRDEEKYGTESEIIADVILITGHLMNGGFLNINDLTSAKAINEEGSVTASQVVRSIRHTLRSNPCMLLNESVFDALLSISLATKINHLEDIMAANVPSVKNELMFDALLESLPYSKPSVRKRALDAFILLACTKAENRDTLVSTLEFPEWIVLLLIRTKINSDNEDDTIKVGIDLLDILLHHALRASRDGAFVLEILSKSFKTTGEANAKSIEQKVLTNLLSFVFKELRGFNKLGVSENSLVMRDNGLKLLSVVDTHLHRIGTDSEASDEDSKKMADMYAEIRNILGTATDVSKNSDSSGHVSAEERWNAYKSLRSTKEKAYLAFVQDWVENDFENLPLSKRCLEIERRELARREFVRSMRIKYERESLKILSEFEGGDFANFPWEVDPIETGKRRRYILRRMKEPPKREQNKKAMEELPSITLPKAVNRRESLDFDSEEKMIQEVQEEEKKLEKKNAREQKGAHTDATRLAYKLTNSMVLSDEPVFKNDEATMVTPLKTFRGSLILTEDCISFTGKDTETGIEHSWIQKLDELHQVQSRRYLLQRSALEFFFLSRETYFIDFGSSEERKNIYKCLIRMKPKNFVPLYLEASNPEVLMRKSDITSRWIRRELSNFDYILALNTLAGRSYLDITQYPVFPHVIADYESDVLDLNDPKTFRDLSKPIGALNPKRLNQVKERYDALKDDPEIPPFHYGSHYSSAGVVMFYLLRLEPFTTLAYNLQGGKFDHADRLFTGVESMWKSVLNDISDVKELTPEFFTMPEMFLNLNNCDFGTTQKGEKVGDVKLPKWASNAVDFVAKQRAALESEHVSKNLHTWIDLIFGFKQRGAEAVKATNVFYYTTYEGNVDVSKITNATMRRALRDQIENFGQTPSQLLNVPHPARQRAHDTLSGSHWLFERPGVVGKYRLKTNETQAIASVSSFGNNLLVINAKLEIAKHQFSPNIPDGTSNPFTFVPSKRRPVASSNSTSSSSGGGLLSSTLLSKSTSLIGGFFGFPQKAMNVLETILDESTSERKPMCITADGKRIFLGGNIDNSVRIYSGDPNGCRLECMQKVYGGIVTSLALACDDQILVVGSVDSTVSLWLVKYPSTKTNLDNIREGLRDNIAMMRVEANSIFNEGSTVLEVIHRREFETFGNNFDAASGNDAYIVGTQPVRYYRGHGARIDAVSVSADLNVIVATSKTNGTSIFRLMTNEVLTNVSALRGEMNVITPDGIIIAWERESHTLRACTLNGRIVAERPLKDLIPLVTSLAWSRSGEYVIVGTEKKTASVAQAGGGGNGGVCLFALPWLSLYNTWALEFAVTSLTLTSDETNIIVGLENGEIVILANPSLSLRLVDNLLQSGWVSGL